MIFRESSHEGLAMLQFSIQDDADGPWKPFAVRDNLDKAIDRYLEVVGSTPARIRIVDKVRNVVVVGPGAPDAFGW
jgi:hypothetical protein